MKASVVDVVSWPATLRFIFYNYIGADAAAELQLNTYMNVTMCS